MWKKLMTLGVLAGALSVTPAFAQQTPAEQQTQPPAATDQQSPATGGTQADQGAMTGNLAGMDVWSSDDEKLGEVSKVSKGADGKVEAIHVDIGTFLGIGSKTVEISAEQFTQKDDRIQLSMTAEDAKALPEVKSE